MNNFQFYSSSMETTALKNIDLGNKLCDALKKDELVLFYQPQFDIHSGKGTGVEALLRWQHPDLGLIQPDNFIPLAEETGLIISIGEWVLQTACAQNKSWQDAGFSPLRVAVNLSARQFREKKLPEKIAHVWRKQSSVRNIWTWKLPKAMPCRT